MSTLEIRKTNGKIYYEKYTRPTLKRQGVDLPYMQIMFNDTKDMFREDHLFDENESIKIRQNSFEQILEKLQTYNLSDTQDDVKGIAFEQFLGTTFRGELGQFFTPRTIVDFMTHVLDPKEGETICDPTCGSGGFLIKAFEYVREQIEEEVRDAKVKLRAELEGDNYDTLSEKEQLAINARIEAMQAKLNKELDTQVEGSRMYNLSHNCIYGTDANPRMARTSKMNMIMHGDGHGGVYHHDGLLNVNGIFEERFDVILTNPPFGARIDKSQKISEADKFTDEVLIAKYKAKYGDAYKNALKQVNDHIGKSLLSLYDVGSMSGLTEVLFMERCLKLLKKGGRMGMVLPEGVLNTSNLQKIREYFEGKAKIILICSIPQDVFIAAGATVKPSLVFFKRFTEEEELQYLGAKTKAEGEIRQKYIGEINVLKEKIETEKAKKLKVKALIGAYLKELIISRIDARNGAFGIVPKELDGAVVTNDFWLFNVNNALPQYLMLVLSSKRFQEYWETQSSGTTNRQRVDEEDFLRSKIALPPLEIQKELLDKYNSLINESVQKDQEIAQLEKSIDEYFLNTLGVRVEDIQKNNGSLIHQINYSVLSRWDVWSQTTQYISLKYSFSKFGSVVKGKPIYGANCKGIKKKSDVRYIRITDINEDGSLNDDFVSAEVVEEKYLLEENDFLIARSGNTVGKTFLYKPNMGKCIFAGYLVKYILNPQVVVPEYVLYYTKLCLNARSLPPISTATVPPTIIRIIKTWRKIPMPAI